MDKALERFWPKVSFNPNGCWDWTAYCHPDGYGRFWDGQKVQPAHRFIFEYMVGVVPDDFELDHLCRNRRCVNFAHLEIVTGSENTKRGLLPDIMRRRQLDKTHCPKGHPYDETNTYHRKDKNGRECKACQRQAQRRYVLNCRT